MKIYAVANEPEILYVVESIEKMEPRGTQWPT